MHYRADRNFFPLIDNPNRPLIEFHDKATNATAAKTMATNGYIGSLSDDHYDLMRSASQKGTTFAKAPSWVRATYTYFHGGVFPRTAKERSVTLKAITAQREIDIARFTNDANTIERRLQQNNSVCNAILCAKLAPAWLLYTPAWLKTRSGLCTDTPPNALPKVTAKDLLAIDITSHTIAASVLGMLTPQQFEALAASHYGDDVPGWAAHLRDQLAPYFPVQEHQTDRGIVALRKAYKLVAEDIVIDYYRMVEPRLFHPTATQEEALSYAKVRWAWCNYTPAWLSNLPEKGTPNTDAGVEPDEARAAAARPEVSTLDTVLLDGARIMAAEYYHGPDEIKKADELYPTLSEKEAGARVNAAITDRRYGCYLTSLSSAAITALCCANRPKWATKLLKAALDDKVFRHGLTDTLLVMRESRYAEFGKELAALQKLDGDVATVNDFLNRPRMAAWRLYKPEWLRSLLENGATVPMDAAELNKTQDAPTVGQTLTAQEAKAKEAEAKEAEEKALTDYLDKQAKDNHPAVCPLRGMVQSIMFGQPDELPLDRDGVVCHSHNCAAWRSMGAARKKLFKNCSDSRAEVEPTRPEDVPESWDFQPYGPIVGTAMMCRHAKWLEDMAAYRERQRSAPVGGCLLLTAVCGGEGVMYKHFSRLMNMDYSGDTDDSM